MSLADLFSAIWNFPLPVVAGVLALLVIAFFAVLFAAELVNRWRDRRDAAK